MANYKTVPNQKSVRINKEKCDKQNLYSVINLSAMEEAARDLDAGAFKLWVYFSKNQDNYEFALSSKAVEQEFGIKIKQYNNAVKELTDKGYLVNTKGNNYEFHENPVITKEDNAVITKEDNSVNTKGNNTLLPKEIRNITDTTINNTINNTKEETNPKEDGTIEHPYIIPRAKLVEKVNQLQQLGNGLFMDGNRIFYKMKEYKGG